MSLHSIPYILMNGKAKEAIEYYQEVLGAKVQFIQTIGEGPKDEVAKYNENELNLIAHAVLKIGESLLFIADDIPEIPFQQGTQTSICLTPSEVSTARQIYEKLVIDGEVLRELSEIYFSPAYGIVKDRFGVTFLIAAMKSCDEKGA